jgi:U3 small nucleolar RNA-associated protein 11
LTTLTNLVKPVAVEDDSTADDGDILDNEETQVLREAGVLPSSSKKRKPSVRRATKHIVFAEDANDGAFGPSLHKRFLILSTAKAHVRGRKSSNVSEDTSPVSSFGAIDLGWKEDAPKKSKKGKAKAVDIAEDEEMEDVEERRSISTVGVHSLTCIYVSYLTLPGTPRPTSQRTRCSIET